MNSIRAQLLALLCCLSPCPGDADSSDWATAVIDYVKGQNAEPAYTNPAVALGEAARYVQDYATSAEAAVTVFQAACMPGQIVSIGNNGRLTLAFDGVVTNADDPVHPYGVDLIVYGNTFFAVAGTDYFNSPWVASSAEPGAIWLSADGTSWFRATNALADALLPTQSLDLNSQPSDYLLPPDPALLTNDYANLYTSDENPWYYSNTVAAYQGSAGGAPVDLSALADSGGAPTSLAFATQIRIVDPPDTKSTEVDAVARVPAVPEAAGWCAVVVLAFVRGRRAAWRVGVHANRMRSAECGMKIVNCKL